MKKIAVSLVLLVTLMLSACTSKTQGNSTLDAADSLRVPCVVKYATGFSVSDSADVRLVSVGKKDRFALVGSDDAQVPDGYVKVRVPISRTICMTSLQLSNFTVLDAHDWVKGLTGTKNLFNADILERVKDGRIVKIGMEGNFDTEMVLAANPDVMPSARRASRSSPISAIRNSTRWARLSGSSSSACSSAKSARPTRSLQASRAATIL